MPTRGAAKIDVGSKPRGDPQVLGHELAVHVGHVHIQIARQYPIDSTRGEPGIGERATTRLKSEMQGAHATQPPDPAFTDADDRRLCRLHVSSAFSWVSS
jgi:hypothetical protein